MPPESPPEVTRTGLQLRSLVRASGQLELSLVDVPVATPTSDEVVVRIDATPINPSDIGLLFGGADMSRATYSGTAARPVVQAPVPEQAMTAMAGRVGESMPVGNEAAGVVLDAGTSEAARRLVGKTVAIAGGGMYAQYRCIAAAGCLELPAGTTAAEGASCFINPLTALGMVDTMRREGHTALVHTAAASNLGQMLNRICLKDGIGLVNIVRKDEQVQLLRSQGAAYVCNSTSPTFMSELVDALVSTGATLGFDATGGGKLAGQVIAAMEAALVKKGTTYNRYGSSTLKQVYVYGRLDPNPVELAAGSFGMAWGVGGWLLFPYLQKIGPEAVLKLRQRIVSELKTTFASRYTRTVSLSGALRPDAVAAYYRRSTGEKYLINPNLQDA